MENTGAAKLKEAFKIKKERNPIPAHQLNANTVATQRRFILNVIYISYIQPNLKKSRKKIKHLKDPRTRQAKKKNQGMKNTMERSYAPLRTPLKPWKQNFRQTLKRTVITKSLRL